MKAEQDRFFDVVNQRVLDMADQIKELGSGQQSPVASGILLDAHSIRAELQQAPDAHGLTPEQAESISNQSDHYLNAALNEQLNDDFWAQYDDVRRRTITALAQQIGGQ